MGISKKCSFLYLLKFKDYRTTLQETTFPLSFLGLVLVPHVFKAASQKSFHLNFELSEEQSKLRPTEVRDCLVFSGWCKSVPRGLDSSFQSESDSANFHRETLHGPQTYRSQNWVSRSQNFQFTKYFSCVNIEINVYFRRYSQRYFHSGGFGLSLFAFSAWFMGGTWARKTNNQSAITWVSSLTLFSSFHSKND